MWHTPADLLSLLGTQRLCAGGNVRRADILLLAHDPGLPGISSGWFNASVWQRWVCRVDFPLAVENSLKFPVGIAGSLEGCVYREEGKTLSVAAGWPDPLLSPQTIPSF